MNTHRKILIIDGSYDYHLTENPPNPELGYLEWGGPYNMAHFDRLFANPSVGAERIAEIASAHIKHEYRGIAEGIESFPGD